MKSNQPATMKAQCFYFPETNRRPWLQQVKRGADYIEVEVTTDATLADILTAARAAGLPRGSSRSGCFEVQTDAGIFTHHNPAMAERGYGRLDPARAIFNTWEQLENAA